MYSCKSASKPPAQLILERCLRRCLLAGDESSAKEPDELNPGGRFPKGLADLSRRMGGRSGMGNFIQQYAII